MSAVKTLVLQSNAFVKMIHWMAQFANFKSGYQGGWVEAMGIMFCKITGDKYVIVEAEGITSGNLVYVETSPQQVAQITRIEEKLKQQDQNIFAGGWFHSHPGHNLFFSGTDIGNQQYWQNSNPNGVGLVFDLTQVTDTFIGFKFFRLDATQNYYEVPYELYGFSEETLIEAFKPVGIDIKTIHRLALHMGLKAKEGIVEFDKIEIPETEDPVGTAKSAIEKAEKAYLQGKIKDTIEQYRIANLLLKDLQDAELYVKSTLKLAKHCILHDYPETAESLLKEIVLVIKRKNIEPEINLGKAEILLGYLADINHKPEDALFHYKKAIDLYKVKKYYKGLYKVYDLSGGACWKFVNRQDALNYFKEALQNLDLAEKENKQKKSQEIWDLLKKAIVAKIKSAEEHITKTGIEQV